MPKSPSSNKFAGILGTRRTVEMEEAPSSPAAKVRTGRPKNKATDPSYTKLTAYVPRTLVSAFQMSMLMDRNKDQSAEVERAIVAWLKGKGREGTLAQCNYSETEV